MINLCPKQKWVKDILKGRMCLWKYEVATGESDDSPR
jgi:hypothetical protein